ncbi:MAG: hypothetical protein ACEQR8_08760 [Cypionkella sp.]
MRSVRIKRLAAVAVLLLLAYAWWDGGEEPLRAIAEPVAVPEAAR